MKPVRELIFFEHHFHDFYNSQTGRVKEKINQVFFLVTHLERVPDKFLKKLVGHPALYEIRIGYAGDIFRMFCCFDNGNLIVLFNGFQKKSQKTPSKEIDRALRIMNQYFKSK
jgi:phage-related protein